MTYKFICNNPFNRYRITESFVFNDNIFNETQIKDITEHCEKNKLKKGSIFNETSDQAVSEIRKSDVCFINKTNENYWIFDIFNKAINEINEYNYNFDLNGYQSIQYTRYESYENGMYNWHMDTCLGPIDQSCLNDQTRKLSVVMLLNEPGKDFEGGDFEINLGLESNPIKVPMRKGGVIFFPSFLIHRVKPVTSGVRKSLVIWVQGPKFK